jgi:hypothetical protein
MKASRKLKMSELPSLLTIRYRLTDIIQRKLVYPVFLKRTEILGELEERGYAALL